jgi:hypothetical protein
VRQIQTTSGKLNIDRTFYRPAINIKDEDGKVIFTMPGKPTALLDAYLNIENLPFKMTERMMSETADWGESCASYEAAAKKMKEKCGYELSSEHIREVTDYVGGRFFEKDKENAKDIDKNLLNTPYTHNKKGILYIMIDGAAINTRVTDENGSTWRENKLGLIFNSNDLIKRKGKNASKDEIHYHIKKKDFCTYLGGVDEFKKHLYACALRNGYGEYETTVIVSDGAAWIRNMAAELFPDAVQILDLFHLEENIFNFGKYLFNNNAEKYTPWAKSLISLAENSRTDELLEQLRKYEFVKLPAGTVNIYNYVYNNREKIDYVGYRAKGYYVGSGPIESANKTVLQRRCKQAGMRWNCSSGQNMLTLCARAAAGKKLELSSAA